MEETIRSMFAEMDECLVEEIQLAVYRACPKELSPELFGGRDNGFIELYNNCSNRYEFSDIVERWDILTIPRAEIGEYYYGLVNEIADAFFNGKEADIFDVLPPEWDDSPSSRSMSELGIICIVSSCLSEFNRMSDDEKTRLINKRFKPVFDKYRTEMEECDSLELELSVRAVGNLPPELWNMIIDHRRMEIFYSYPFWVDYM